ncbi:hypothetical protein HY640_03725 [Candidatus Woesearchaeota archaeon]|nr:hypothetical protein [Candidatus Woesearchaeota archaeon]
MPLAKLFGVNVLILRGFGSLSAITRALKRAIARGIKLILYIGDWDPSGLEIEEVCRRETGIEFKRVMVTKEQATKLKLIPMPANRRDSRWKKFVQKHGNKVWEVESLRPRTFRKLLEQALREAVPTSFLEEMELRTRASKFVRPYIARLGRKMGADVRGWIKQGLSEEEIRRRLLDRYRR